MKVVMITSLVLLVIMTLHYHSYADQQLIENTCKNTPNYNLCISTLKADKSSATADIRGLALILVGAVKDKTNEAMSAVENLIKGGGPLSEALQQCKRVYNAVLVGDIEMAEQGLKFGNPKFAETGMADTTVEADTCENALQGALGKGKPSPLTAVNHAVADLAAVARAVIRNLL